MTLRWNYSASGWEKGAFITVTRKGGPHCKKTSEVHLDQVIQMNGLISGTCRWNIAECI